MYRTAYTALPVVLLHINAQLSTNPAEMQPYQENLICLLEAQRLFAFRHGVDSSLAWADVALKLFRAENTLSTDSRVSHPPEKEEVTMQPMKNTFDYFFECRSVCYTLFVRYMDLKLSTGIAAPDDLGIYNESSSTVLSTVQRECAHEEVASLSELSPSPDFTQHHHLFPDTWSSCDSPSWFLIGSPAGQGEEDDEKASCV